MNGYQYHNTSRKEKHRIAKRNSGGLGVYIRNNIAKGVEVSKIVNYDFMMWIMLRKDFFNLCHDVYFGHIYIVPEGSTYLRGDEFHILESEIAKIPEDAEILICGDLNAHTNISTDYIDDDLNGSDGDLANILPNDHGGKRSQEIKRLREKMN